MGIALSKRLHRMNAKPILGLCLMLLTGCGSLPVVDVPSQNQNSRIQYLVLHFTAQPFDESMRLLTQRTDRPVSAHYLVPEPGDPTYPHRELNIYRLVPESQRAWHAGRSTWGRKQSLNDASIGIEIVNRSQCTSSDPDAAVQTPEMQTCTWLDYSEEQIALVIRLLQDILARHPDIDAMDVVAHSDIAPDRRLDPGPKFPWQRLHDHGIGAWYDDSTVDTYRQRFADTPPSLGLIQRGLRAYGYGLEDTGEHDLRTRFVVRAFQMHFRPSRMDGVVDVDTAAILFALLEKYRPRSLRELLEEPQPSE